MYAASLAAEPLPALPPVLPPTAPFLGSSTEWMFSMTPPSVLRARAKLKLQKDELFCLNHDLKLNSL
jgi:hypothetical protein